MCFKDARKRNKISNAWVLEEWANKELVLDADWGSRIPPHEATLKYL